MTQEITIEDIDMKPQIESAVHEWWNSASNMHNRTCGSPEANIRLDIAYTAIRVALLALTREPVVPSDNDPMLREVWMRPLPMGSSLQAVCTEWQRHMFILKPDPVPEEVKDLMCDIEPGYSATIEIPRSEWNEKILAAVEVGKRIRGSK